MRSAKISGAEPVSQLRYVKIVESGEELVDFLQACPALLLDRDRFHYRRETLMRKTLAEKLCAANANLPSGYRLAIIEGWRAPHIQRRMYQAVWGRFQRDHPDWSETTLKRVVNKYSAPLNSRVPPPHTTGGGRRFDAGGQRWQSPSIIQAPSTRTIPIAPPLDAPGLSDAARKTRDILAAALVPTGITNYPSEFWHWSWGDQGWAYRGGHPSALYGTITPADYRPDPAEDIDQPLVLVDA